MVDPRVAGVGCQNDIAMPNVRTFTPPPHSFLSHTTIIPATTMTSTLLHDILRPHGVESLKNKLAQASLLKPTVAIEDSEDEIVGIVSAIRALSICIPDLLSSNLSRACLRIHIPPHDPPRPLAAPANALSLATSPCETQSYQSIEGVPHGARAAHIRAAEHA